MASKNYNMDGILLQSVSIPDHTPLLVERPVRLTGPTFKGSYQIGAYSYIRRGQFSRGGKIGRFCSLAPDLTVGDSQHPTDYLSTHPFQYKAAGFAHWDEYAAFESKTPSPDQKGPVIIGHDVWIGANVTIARGITIGDGAIVGACSFVNKDVPPNAIVGGVPARFIRWRFDSEEIRERLAAISWWDYTLTSLQGVPFDDIAAALTELERRKAEGLLARYVEDFKKMVFYGTTVRVT